MQHLAWRGMLDGGLKFRPMTLPDRLIDHNSQPKQYDEAGLNAPHIVETVLAALGNDVTLSKPSSGPNDLIPDLFREIANAMGEATLPANLSMLTSLIGRIVAASARHPLIVLLLAVALTAMALVYSSRHFAMTADTAELISTKHEWRQRELAYEAAFPSLQKLTVVVIDGATAELGESAAARLAAALASKPALFQSVRRPDGGPFFDRNGLLFLAPDKVKETMEGLLHSQFLLATLAADPSLRGVLATIKATLQGVRHGQARLGDIEPLMSALAATFDKALAGEAAYFSWQALIAAESVGEPAGRRQTRRVLLVQPVMDYTQLQPGAAASNAVRAAARSLGLDPSHGVSVHLTGPVPLGDEEFASLAEDWHLVAAAMVVSLLGILWVAVHSARVVFAIVVTTVIGLIMTAGVGLLATGRFNLISVAFIPLFVGLGIDFSIQFSVRFLAERSSHPELRAALTSSRPGGGAAAGAGCRRHRRGLFRVSAHQLHRRGRTRGHCRPRHGHRVRLEHHASAGIAQPASPGAWRDARGRISRAGAGRGFPQP